MLNSSPVASEYGAEKAMIVAMAWSGDGYLKYALRQHCGKYS